MSRVLRPFPKCLNTLAFIGRLCLFGTNFFSLKPRLFEPTILILHVYLLQVTHLQGDFFNWASPENVSRLAPPNLLGLAPP